MPLKVLVTGGAGYIGSATVRMLVSAGYDVVVFDDLSSGHLEALPASVEVRTGSVLDPGALAGAADGVDAALHFAADIEAGESVVDPSRFWHKNTAGTLNLLDALRDASVGKLVFSSTAAVYGNPDTVPIREDFPLHPENPYGQTKLASEMAIHDYGAAHGISFVNLRYFNAAGADPSGKHGPDHKHKTHLITLCMEAALGRLPELQVLGTDYDTRDGTAIRDYVHVEDLASAHLKALEILGSGPRADVYNLGYEHGYTVREVVERAKEITAVDFPTSDAPRRAGDPAILIASSQAALEHLGWRAERSDLDSILSDQWRWHTEHPDGYAG